MPLGTASAAVAGHECLAKLEALRTTFAQIQSGKITIVPRRLLNPAPPKHWTFAMSVRSVPVDFVSQILMKLL